MKHKTILAILAIALFAAGASAVNTKADFSGAWVLDKTKSEGLPPGMDQTMTVKQSEDRVEVQLIVSGDQGERTIADSFIFDGKENDFTLTLPNGEERKGKRISKWSSDETGFDSSDEITIENPDGEEMKIKVTRHWQLSADGKTLTIEQSQETRRGVRKMKRVFVKK